LATTKRDIRERMKNFINQNGPAGSDNSRSSRIKRAEEELYNHYLKQMRIRDRATRNLENINKAREITG